MFPNDHGPIYKETIAGRFPVEPWNTYSNLFFLLIIIFWSIKVYKDFKKHSFIGFCLPVLFIGYVGGTIYHATRSSDLWLFMDWVPIMLLSLFVSVHFFVKQRLHWSFVILMFFLPFIYMFLINKLGAPEFIKRMMSYPVLALIILFPIIRWLYLTKWKNWYLITTGVIFFIIAIYSRIIDLKGNSLPMGTHFLWHSFGAFASHMLIMYIFRDDLLFEKLKKIKK
jgi:hemolysin III